MTDTKFFVGSEWKTRCGGKAIVLPERTPSGNLCVKHEGVRAKWLAHSPSTGECIGLSHRDLIAPWDATPSAKDAAFAAMLAALRPICSEFAQTHPLIVAGLEAIKQAEQCQ